jgi:hypothetical protein
MDMLDPAGRATAEAKALAKRAPRLEGAVVGLLDNSKPNARVLLEGVALGLRERHGAREVRVWQKPTASRAAAGAVLDEIAAACDVALTASAD